MPLQLTGPAFDADATTTDRESAMAGHALAETTPTGTAAS
ncbi:hypothetical protein SAMN04487949_3575 [Halogranum gelatinilyticum]|uniref:Uncharacterized protein n=1 Tax=Halogranum gelatinilyticum TaxID=660521 RepID=A0A1G9ZAS4_9EURY|nr:hypothetical protein SAMN04487949_3575 [Halogranum gelatinilyticum]